MYKNCIYGLLAYLAILMSACGDDHATEVIDVLESTPNYLPMLELDLIDISSFENTSEEWSIVGKVHSDFMKDGDMTTDEGSGILVHRAMAAGKGSGTSDEQSNINLLEHGDILMELDFLAAKGSGASLLYMSRYGIVISDNNTDPVCGSIPTPNADTGNSMIEPSVDCSRAPGLWQSFKVLFRAPRFDADGAKTANAKFEYVYHNGYLIHEDVELENPITLSDSNIEVSKAPFQIQNQRGALAIRDIKYKTYEHDSIRFSDLNYKLYEGKFNEIPDYSSMAPVKSGTVQSFASMTDLSGKNDGFAIQYDGSFTIPTDGDYLIETIIDDGGTLIIDDSLQVRVSVGPGERLDREIIYLDAGSHTFVTNCYAFDRWATRLVFNIEGPNMEKRSYLSNDFIATREASRAKKSYDVDINQSVEMIRGFVDHKGEKITHTVSVGNPMGVHYSYDTRYNALLNVWQGDFADVSEMWVGRGAEQRLKPRSAILSLNSGIPFVKPGLTHDPKGFRLTEDGRPIFNFSYGKVEVVDDINPNADGSLMRTLQFENKGNPVDFRIAEEHGITWVNDEWTSIGNLYHLSIREGKGQVSIESASGIDQLVYSIPSGTSTLSYEISW